MTNTSLVRPAREDDLPVLLSMARRFVAESELPLTFDPGISAATLCDTMRNARGIALVEDDSRVLTGGIMGFVDRDFCFETCAYVTKMYVEKEFRGLGTARSLVSAFEVEAKRRGASVCFSSATAGMGERVEQLYVRLFERFGYDVLGRVLVRRI